MTAAGWYEDPENGARGRRYWDGQDWTSHYEHADAGVATEPPPYQPPAAAPMSIQQTVINVGSRKSVGGAVLLAFLFGPLGMLYSTVLGGVVMFFVSLVIAIPTLGLGLLLTIPIGMIWAGVAASSHNSRLGMGMSNQVLPANQYTPAPQMAQPPPPPPLAALPATAAHRGSTSDHADRMEEPVRVEADTAESSSSAGVLTTEAVAADDGVFCEACGQGLGGSHKFCPGCGHRQAEAG